MHLCDINDCLHIALNMVNNEVKYHCSIDTEFNELPAIMGNAGKLIQVFTNLLINGGQAIDSNQPDSGKIRVKTYTKDHKILIDISDNGKGIATDSIDKIFNPFFTTKPVGEGTGLGLSICYDIIKEHAGDIRVVSAIQQGTTFTVELPLNEKAASETVPSEKAASGETASGENASEKPPTVTP